MGLLIIICLVNILISTLIAYFIGPYVNQIGVKFKILESLIKGRFIKNQL